MYYDIDPTWIYVETIEAKGVSIMKKLIAIVLSLVMLLALTACQQAEKNEDVYVRTESVIEIFSGDQLLSEVRTEYAYDAFGNTTEMFSYQNGQLYSSMKVAESDESGRPVRLTITDEYGIDGEEMYNYYNEAGELYKYEYKADGVITQSMEKTFDAQGRTATTVNKIPSTGTVTTMTYTYNEDGTLASRLMDVGSLGANLIVYEYDDQGREIKETTYEGKTTGDPVREYIESTYDDTARTCTEVITPVNGNSGAGTRVTTYDEAGNEILVESFNAEGELSIRTTSVWKKLN